jgi:hypothetical protein
VNSADERIFCFVDGGDDGGWNVFLGIVPPVLHVALSVGPGPHFWREVPIAVELGCQHHHNASWDKQNKQTNKNTAGIGSSVG